MISVPGKELPVADDVNNWRSPERSRAVRGTGSREGRPDVHAHCEWPRGIRPESIEGGIRWEKVREITRPEGRVSSLA
jgi:hypothetical protein